MVSYSQSISLQPRSITLFLKPLGYLTNIDISNCSKWLSSAGVYGPYTQVYNWLQWLKANDVGKFRIVMHKFFKSQEVQRRPDFADINTYTTNPYLRYNEKEFYGEPHMYF